MKPINEVAEELVVNPQDGELVVAGDGEGLVHKKLACAATLWAKAGLDFSFLESDFRIPKI